MRRLALGSVVLVIVVLGAGCLGMDGGPDRSDRAEATLEEVNSALQDVTTYRAETELRATAVAEEETISRDATIVGAVNVTQKRSNMTLEMDGETRRAYVDNRTMYQECERPWGWANESIDGSGQWIETTTLGRHVDLLDSGDLRLETTSTVADGGTVTLVGAPSEDALREFREESNQPAVGDTKIENVSLQLVVDNRTHRPIEGSMSFEAVGDGATATATMHSTYSGYDDPVRIAIPEEATENEFDWSGGCPGS
ncbi:MAG: hypothetical protein ACLFNC_04535 [Halodesulfurarchaeum sp.]